MTNSVDNLRAMEVQLLEMESLAGLLSRKCAGDGDLIAIITQFNERMHKFQAIFYDHWGDI